MMFDDFEPKPDRWDRLIRFSLGFLAGAVSGAIYFRPGLDFGTAAIYLVAAEGLIFGFLAARYGDRAWRWFRDWWA